MTSGVGDQESGGLPVEQTFGATDSDRNEVFGQLVTGDSDIIGLVAYSIYKQNKHDWLVSFAKQKGREPNESELQAYIVGESTARRLATYRHLAQSTLDGNGPEVSASPSSESFAQRGYAIAQRNKIAAGRGGASPAVKAAGYVVALLVALVAIYLAAKFGLPGVARP
jgi:hypothetical protein